jgi:hypothetical protein
LINATSSRTTGIAIPLEARFDSCRIKNKNLEESQNITKQSQGLETLRDYFGAQLD